MWYSNTNERGAAEWWRLNYLGKEFCMVISTVNQVVYNGDGVTVAWPYTFRIIDATDIQLTIIDADGTETPVSADYYVDTVNNTVYYPGYAPGAEPPAEDQPAPVQSGQKLLIYRQLPITQEKNLGDKWPFNVIELGLDKLTMILQQIAGWWNRCLKISPVAEAEHPDFDMTFPIEAGKSFRVNAEGTGFEVSEDPGISAEIAIEAANTAAEAAEIAAAAAAAVELQAVWYDNVSALRSANIPVGITAGTKGYYEPNDGGGGTYVIREADNDTDDGGAIIILNNGNVAQLMVEEDTVLFKQWGAAEDGVTDDTSAVTNAVAYATANSIAYVKGGGTLVTSAGIDVAFNLEFNKIIYNGSDHAIVIDSIRDTFVKGERIDTASGSGIKITCTTANCVQNHVDVREIVADNGNCVDVLPVNGHGVMQNHLFFGRLKSSNGKGVNSFIPKDTGKYSWEGEDIYAVACAVAKVGINFEIEPTSVTSGGVTTTDCTDDGTITGITFLHLSCEYSETGVRIKCGKNVNPVRTSDATIKSIIINNMRCRETDRSTMFLDATGLLKDIFVYPTSAILYYQWRLVTSYRFPCKVVASIENPGRILEVGRNLCSVDGLTYIENKTNRIYRITSQSTNFRDICKKYKDQWQDSDTQSDKFDVGMYMPGVIEISSSLSGTINVTLRNFLNESVEHIHFSVYAGQSVKLTIPYSDTSSTVETFTNSSNTRRLYDVCVWKKISNGSNVIREVLVRVVDRGTVDAF